MVKFPTPLRRRYVRYRSEENAARANVQFLGCE